jgi:multidrug efflux system outer membrane protein
MTKDSQARTTPPPRYRIHALLVAVSLVTGCAAVGPDYKAPAAQVASGWQAPPPHRGRLSDLAGWWAQFDDPALLRLQQAAEAESPTLARAWARIEQARATLATARAATTPGVTGQASATGGQRQTTAAQGTRSLGIDASWEVDLFGRIRRNNEAAQARLQARQSDWHDARISLAAEVADHYVQYRACTLLAGAYSEELASTRQTLRATESLVRAGLNARADGDLARASAAGTADSALAQAQECTLLVKTLVNLSGLEEASVRQALGQGDGLPRPAEFSVRQVPADVLRQRPDLASLERELASASAEIGVAEADLLPTLSLVGNLTISSALTSWSFGPQLALSLLDGGARRAAIDSARASFVSAYADWRQGVRDAVTEVEQALARLDSSAARMEEAMQASSAYTSYFDAIETEWRAGTRSLLTLEEARRQALASKTSLIALQRDRVRYWIALYKAVGGNWQADLPIATPSPANLP